MRTHTLFAGALYAALFSAMPSQAGAQGWDVPSFLPAAPGDDLGGYYIKPDGAEWGLAGIWRQSGSLNLGARVGVLRPTAGSDLVWLAGGETWGSLLSAGPRFPVEAVWTLGFGASFGSAATAARVPVGVSVGRRLDFGGVAVLPYVHPRLGLDLVAPEVGESTTDLAFLVDVGVDLGLGPSITVRAGAALGDGDALGVGVAWRMARPVEVR